MHLPSPWLKYIKQNSSFDNWTHWLSNFWHCIAFGSCDITSFLWHVRFSDLSLPQCISRFWWKICSPNQLSSFLFIFLRMEMSPYKKIETIRIYHDLERSEGKLKTMFKDSSHQSTILWIPLRGTLRVKLHLAHNLLSLPWKLWKCRSLHKRAKIMYLW